MVKLLNTVKLCSLAYPNRRLQARWSWWYVSQSRPSCQGRESHCQWTLHVLGTPDSPDVLCLSLEELSTCFSMHWHPTTTTTTTTTTASTNTTTTTQWLYVSQSTGAILESQNNNDYYLCKLYNNSYYYAHYKQNNN